MRSVLKKFSDVLNLLDTFIGDYPVYLYLTDLDYNMLWNNSCLARKVPSLKEGNPGTCHRVLFGSDEPCPGCPVYQKTDTHGVSKEVLKRRFVQSDREVFLEVISMPVRSPAGEVVGVFRMGLDVTEAEKKRNALREREKLFVSIIDTTADAIFFVNNNDEILSWNKGAEDLFGYTADEIIGKPGVILMPKELIELSEGYYIKQEMEKHGFIKKYETQRLTKSGQLIYVDLTRTTIRDGDGQAIGSSVIIKDITSRKELEFELRRTILELSKLNDLDEILYGTHDLDDILRIILIAMTAGEGLRFNRAFLLLVDEESEMLHGHLAIGPTNEMEAHQIWSQLQDQYRSLKEVVKNFTIDLEGNDLRINQMVRNIHVPLNHTENILVQSLVNRKTYQVKDGHAIDAPHLTFEVFGNNLFDLLGSDSFVVVPLSSRQERIGLLITDNRITHKDITPDEIESLKVFANQSSMAIENAKLYENQKARVKELQEAYAKLEENADRLVKAERLAAIGEMSAKIAHEIRNPLVSIGGFARLLEKKAPENKEIKNYAGIIRNQVSHLESMLNNILGTASPPKPRFRKIDIHTIFRRVIEIMEESLESRNVKIEQKYFCESSTIWADEKMLHQVFLNILKNAIEAIGEMGFITITTKCQSQNIQVRIGDTGSGISDDNLKRIYDPFFSTKSAGTGLGLSISRQIIQDHHGTIAVFSKQGKGTEVQITLPRFRESEENR